MQTILPAPVRKSGTSTIHQLINCRREGEGDRNNIRERKRLNQVANGFLGRQESISVFAQAALGFVVHREAVATSTFLPLSTVELPCMAVLSDLVLFDPSIDVLSAHTIRYSYFDTTTFCACQLVGFLRCAHTSITNMNDVGPMRQSCQEHWQCAFLVPSPVR